MVKIALISPDACSGNLELLVLTASLVQKMRFSFGAQQSAACFAQTKSTTILIQDIIFEKYLENTGSLYGQNEMIE